MTNALLRFCASLTFGIYLGSAIRNAFIETTDASLRTAVCDLTMAVLFLWIFCVARFADTQNKDETK